MSDFNTLVLYCRAGFEKECGAEISTRLSEIGIYGYPRFETGQAYVVFHCQTPGGAMEAVEQLRFRNLIFARQWFAALPLFEQLPASDRIAPIIEQAHGLPAASELVAEVLDTTEGRELQGFARKFGSALSQALRQESIMQGRKQRADWRLHMLVIDGRTLWLGAAPVRNS